MRVQEEMPTRRRAKNKNAIRQNILLTILTPKTRVYRLHPSVNLGICLVESYCENLHT
jgi:hypothetical protein